MKKIIYFFIVADISFEKSYVNTQYNRDDSDRHAFILKEVFGIEQKSEETDDVFFQSLKEKAQSALDTYMNMWVEKRNNEIKAGEGWKWAKGRREIENISRVS